MKYQVWLMKTQEQSSFLMELDFTDLKKTMLQQKKLYTATLNDLKLLRKK